MSKVINKQIFIVDTSVAKPNALQVMRGETVLIECRFVNYGLPVDLSGMTGKAYWRSKDMPAGEWYVSEDVRVDRLGADWTWKPDDDAGKDDYEWFLRITDDAGTSYRAFGKIGMLGSPAGDPTVVPIPSTILDFDQYEILNAPWDVSGILKGDGVGGIEAAVPGEDYLTLASVDEVPTDGSANPVSSNGVYDALAGKVSKNGDTITGTLGVSAFITTPKIGTSSATLLTIPNAQNANDAIARVSDLNGYERSHDFTYITGTDNVTKAFDWSGTVTLQMIENAGYDHDDIKAIVLGDKVTELGTSTFNFQSNLISVDFGEGIQTIGADAFFNDYRIPSLVFPPSLQSIGQNAFANCNGVTYCLFEQKTEAQVKAMSNYGNWGILAPLTVASQQWVDETISNLDADDVGALPSSSVGTTANRGVKKDSSTGKVEIALGTNSALAFDANGGLVVDSTLQTNAATQSDWNEADNTKVDFIKNKPTIPAAQVNSDWTASSGVSQILNKPALAQVATTGSYTDLSNTPTIPDASTSAPAMDGTASAGSATTYSRGDHVHPTDTSRASTADATLTTRETPWQSTPGDVGGVPFRIVWLDIEGVSGWVPSGDGINGEPKGDENSTHLEWTATTEWSGSETLVANRTIYPGFKLGNQDDKPLAKSVDFEAHKDNTAVHTKGSSIADAFDATDTYAVGDYVMKDGQLYKCTTAHSGAWSDNDFTQVSMADQIGNIGTILDSINGEVI